MTALSLFIYLLSVPGFTYLLCCRWRVSWVHEDLHSYKQICYKHLGTGFWRTFMFSFSRWLARGVMSVWTVRLCSVLSENTKLCSKEVASCLLFCRQPMKVPKYSGCHLYLRGWSPDRGHSVAFTPSLTQLLWSSLSAIYISSLM